MINPYNEYKSNNDWVDNIPVHWDVEKIRELFTERKEKVSDKEYAPLSVSRGGVVPQISTVAKSNDGENRKLVRKGDFAINSRSDRRGSSGLSVYDGSVSLINIVLCSRSSLNGRYTHYLLKSHFFIEEYYRNGRGIVADLWTTRYAEMKSIVLPLPPLSEQDQIVRYLDWQVSKINKLISALKKQFALLKEQKKVVINETVTKGLDPNVPMKDSGINWIGKIPTVWETIRVKRCLKITNGENPLTKGNIPVFGSGTESFKTCGEYKEPPAVLLGRKGSINNPNYINIRYWNVDTAFDVKPKCTNLKLKYFYYCSICFDYDFYITRTAIPSITQTDYGNMLIPYPSMVEQESIMRFLDDFCDKINSLINSINSKITLLVEYRTRLVSDVVTGQIDVRDIDLPEFEYIEDEADDTPDDENTDVEDVVNGEDSIWQ